MDKLNEPLSEAELDQLDALLLDLAEQVDRETGEEIDCVLGVSELDGYLTALASGPVLVPFSEWYPALWDGRPPSFGEQREAEQLTALLMRHWNGIVGQLEEAPEAFEPLFEARDHGEDEVLVPDAWCYGYLRGMGLCEEKWQPLFDQQPELLVPFLTFSGHLEEAGGDQPDEQERGELLALLPELVRDFHALWRRERSPSAPQRREAPKVGRNDPCPCGSGRKFKQCCMN